MGKQPLSVRTAADRHNLLQAPYLKFAQLHQGGYSAVASIVGADTRSLLPSALKQFVVLWLLLGVNWCWFIVIDMLEVKSSALLSTRFDNGPVRHLTSRQHSCRANQRQTMKQRDPLASLHTGNLQTAQKRTISQHGTQQ